MSQTEPITDENIFRAFSENHVIHLTGLTKSQLRYWDKTGFFAPNYSKQKGPYGRVYSFRDVAGLKTISILRNKHKISLQHLRQVAEKLSDLGIDLWAKLTLYILKKEVHFQEPGTEKVRGALSDQYAAIPLIKIINDISKQAENLKKRQKNLIGKIERHRYVAHNAWVVAGTRIPTRAIKSFRDAGYSIAKIKREYPMLTTEDIKAALSHEKKLSSAA